MVSSEREAFDEQAAATSCGETYTDRTMAVRGAYRVSYILSPLGNV
jgi:hypothetical protein